MRGMCAGAASRASPHLARYAVRLGCSPGQVSAPGFEKPSLSRLGRELPPAGCASSRYMSSSLHSLGEPFAGPCPMNRERRYSPQGVITSALYGDVMPTTLEQLIK